MIEAAALSPDLLDAISCALAAAENSRDPWWIIGSAAMVLHGLADLEPGDVDLLMSVPDARRVLAAAQSETLAESGDDRFRSEVHGRLAGGRLSVDVMGGFSFLLGDRWEAVAPATRVAFRLPVGVAYAPALPELIHITRGFGRPKDLIRATALERLLSRRP